MAFREYRGLVFGLFIAALCGAAARAVEMELTLETRDPETGKILLTTEKVDSTHVGVIAVDVWNYHWCKTAERRIDAIVPRIDEALEAARSLGMMVMLCPSDVVDNYVGYPQRESVLALPLVPVPVVEKVDFPTPPFVSPCACGNERCVANFGWDAMHPALRIGDADLMPNTQAEVYAICRKRGLTHLIYVGFHTQVCVLGKPMAMKAMKSAGLRCVLARDMTDAHPAYIPARNFTPDLNTAEVIEHFEKYFTPTISFQEELTKLGKWDTNRMIDPVRLAPWGTRMRPHLFENPVTVTLTTPLEPDAEIRYTLDGSVPMSNSTLYTAPIVFSNTTQLRVAGFRNGRQVCLESEGYFARLGPRPPAPDVYLGDVTPIRNVGFGHTTSHGNRYPGTYGPPRTDQSNNGQSLEIERKTYRHGIGMHAPSEMSYRLKPEWSRFVALVGADENIVNGGKGSNLARYPSIVFKVFIDGREAAASPVMRVLSPAWRFDVTIPRGAKMLSVVAMDGGDGSREDLADWVNSGFVFGR